MTQPFLTHPSTKYKHSFIEAVIEFKQSKIQAYDALSLVNLKRDFNSYVTAEKNKAKGIGLLANQVPYALYWLIDQDRFIGRLRLRYYDNEYLLENTGHIGYNIRPSAQKQGYGKLILKLGLEKAKARGFTKVLLTCKSTNLGSRKIIEANGGQLAKTKQIDDTGLLRLYYWIKPN